MCENLTPQICLPRVDVSSFSSLEISISEGVGTRGLKSCLKYMSIEAGYTSPSSIPYGPQLGPSLGLSKTILKPGPSTVFY